jgi:hypothetical protein
MALGLIALVAYRRHLRTKRELQANLAHLIKSLAEETNTDYKSLAYDEHLLGLIGSDAEYEELLDYIETYYLLGHA